MFHTAVLSLERKVNIQAISSLSVDTLSRKQYTGFMGHVHSWQKLMQPHWSHWGSASLHQLHLQPNIIYTFIVPISKRSKAEVGSLCDHWLSSLSESMWMTLRSFLWSNLPLSFLATNLQFAAPRQAPVHAYICSVGVLSYKTHCKNQWSVILFTSYFKPGCKLSGEEASPSNFYPAWAQWYIIPIDALGIPVKKTRILETPISSQSA